MVAPSSRGGRGGRASPSDSRRGAPGQVLDARGAGPSGLGARNGPTVNGRGRSAPPGHRGGRSGGRGGGGSGVVMVGGPGPAYSNSESRSTSVGPKASSGNGTAGPPRTGVRKLGPSEMAEAPGDAADPARGTERPGDLSGGEAPWDQPVSSVLSGKPSAAVGPSLSSAAPSPASASTGAAPAPTHPTTTSTTRGAKPGPHSASATTATPPPAATGSWAALLKPKPKPPPPPPAPVPPPSKQTRKEVVEPAPVSAPAPTRQRPGEQPPKMQHAKEAKESQAPLHTQQARPTGPPDGVILKEADILKMNASAGLKKSDTDKAIGPKAPASIVATNLPQHRVPAAVDAGVGKPARRPEADSLEGAAEGLGRVKLGQWDALNAGGDAGGSNILFGAFGVDDSSSNKKSAATSVADIWGGKPATSPVVAASAKPPSVAASPSTSALSPKEAAIGAPVPSAGTHGPSPSARPPAPPGLGGPPIVNATSVKAIESAAQRVGVGGPSKPTGPVDAVKGRPAQQSPIKGGASVPPHSSHPHGVSGPHTDLVGGLGGYPPYMNGTYGLAAAGGPPVGAAVGSDTGLDSASVGYPGPQTAQPGAGAGVVSGVRASPLAAPPSSTGSMPAATSSYHAQQQAQPQSTAGVPPHLSAAMQQQQQQQQQQPQQPAPYGQPPPGMAPYGYGYYPPYFYQNQAAYAAQGAVGGGQFAYGGRGGLGGYGNPGARGGQYGMDQFPGPQASSMHYGGGAMDYPGVGAGAPFNPQDQFIAGGGQSHGGAGGGGSKTSGSHASSHSHGHSHIGSAHDHLSGGPHGGVQSGNKAQGGASGGPSFGGGGYGGNQSVGSHIGGGGYQGRNPGLDQAGAQSGWAGGQYQAPGGAHTWMSHGPQGGSHAMGFGQQAGAMTSSHSHGNPNMMQQQQQQQQQFQGYGRGGAGGMSSGAQNWS